MIEPFILTTVDTIFDEREFHDYVLSFQDKIAHGTDALMGVTDYIDDEKTHFMSVLAIPCVLTVITTQDRRILAIFLQVSMVDACSPCHSRSCIERGESRMRNFQRALVASGFRMEAIH